MSLAQQIEDDFKREVLDTNDFAQSAVYTKYSDGTTSNLSVVKEQVTRDDLQNEGRLQNDHTVMFVYLIFNPSMYDTITLDGDVWQVKSFSGNRNCYRIEVSMNDINTRKHTKGRFR